MKKDVFDSTKQQAPFFEEFFALIQYRELVYQLVARSIKVRYKRSVLGVAWTMLNPLFTMLVMSLVFSTLFRFQIPRYPVYVLSGIIAWSFFSSSTQLGLAEMISSGHLIGKIYLPKSTFIVSAVVTSLVNLSLSLVPLFFVMLIQHSPFTASLLILPVSILILFCFSLGVCFIVSTAAVYFADIVPIYEVLLVIIMYATPIMYPKEIIPEHWRFIINLNPMVHILQLFRQPLFEGTLPPINEFVISTIIAIGTLLFGWYLFTKRINDYAYRI